MCVYVEKYLSTDVINDLKLRFIVATANIVGKMLVVGYSNLRFKLWLHQYVVPLSNAHNPLCFS